MKTTKSKTARISPLVLASLLIEVCQGSSLERPSERVSVQIVGATNMGIIDNFREVDMSTDDVGLLQAQRHVIGDKLNRHAQVHEQNASRRLFRALNQRFRASQLTRPAGKGTSFRSECISERYGLPATWAAPSKLQAELAKFPVPKDVNRSAAAAARVAFKEMSDFCDEKAEWDNLAGDCLEAVLAGAFAGGNMRDVQRSALSLGLEIWMHLVSKSIKNKDDFSCKHVKSGDLLLYTNYGKYFQQFFHQDRALNKMQRSLEQVVGSGLSKCISVDELLGISTRRYLSRYPRSLREASLDSWIDPIFNMVLDVVHIVGVLGNPNLRSKMPPGTFDFVASFWAYMFDYPVFHASEYQKDGIWLQPEYSDNFEQNAFIMTHLSYVVTGYSRYAFREADSPLLVKYLREHFYDSVVAGSLDLCSEFVDNLKQLGCTNENDVQTRDGTLFILQRYDDAGKSFVKIWNPGNYKDPYSQMHQALTAFIGLRDRVIEDAPFQGSFPDVAHEAVKLALKKWRSKRAKADKM